MNSRTCRMLQRSALAVAVAGIATPASASFFAIAEQNASGIGTAYAGGAAIAEDASTVWYNPAGMTRLTRPQLVFAGSYIDPSFKPTLNSASTAAAFGGTPIGGGAGKDPGQAAFVPSFYYTHPLTKDFSVGGGINAPYGLTTEYDSTWAGRYHAIKSDIEAINYNIAAAYKFNDMFSGGVGLNYQHFKAELTQAVDFATICTVAAGGAFTGACGAGAGFNPNNNPNDGNAKVTADGNAWGYNLGLLAQVTNDLRVGAAYRSKMTQKLSGDFNISTPGTVPGALLAGTGLVNSGAKADVVLPASMSISAYQQLGPKWAVMADVTRTNWSSIPELRIQFDSNQADSVVTLNLKNSYRYSVGGSYKPNDAWVLRAGIALDQSPVPDSANRTPRLPDADRTWYAIGAGFQASPTLNFDFGYVYIKVDNAQVNKTATATNENAFRGNLSVDYTGSIQILSAQARWMF
ncbi:MAG TPA: outer membrane protein transport protein [Burkholderiales bacterium]|nr:outer membrane protein transport protein [Burkholderiales bacterium]